MALAVACAGGGWFGVRAQDGSATARPALVVTPGFSGDQTLAADSLIELSLNRPLGKDEGRVALFIGQMDVTSLCAIGETSLHYGPKLVPLSSGQSLLTVYLVPPEGAWREVARFTLRVEEKKNESADTKIAATAAKPATAAAQAGSPAQQPATAETARPATKHFGFDKLVLTPALVIGIKSQPAQSNFPLTARPDRPTFTDLTMQGSIKSEAGRGLFGSQSQFDFVGASFQKEALRFGQLGERAPQVDLASYLMQIQIGKVKYQAGHFSFGTLRHLMSSFSSRGLMVTVPIAGRGDLSLAAMNGSSVVGFGNFFGLDKRRHQLLSGTLGWEFLQKRPGGLRFEAGMLDGWLQPVNGFSQGSINDAERSRGIAFRVLASDAAQRFKIDSGLTRSLFVNPADALLNQTANVKPLPALTRNARFLDASAQVIKDKPITKEKKANLTFGFRHERVDPLFRSLGASVQADKFTSELSAVANLGDFNAQFTHARFNDNLANIPSILKSLTRANTLTVGVPLAAFFSDPQKPSPLWPRLSYTFNQIHQFGAAIPVRGGFEIDRGAIPDQVATSQAFTADWQVQKLRLGYRLNHSLQDNRQPGFAQADLAGLVNGFNIGLAASGALDLGLDINDERADNRGARTLDHTLRLAPTMNWRMNKRMTFASNFSTTRAADEARTKRNRNIEFDLQWTYQFGFERDRLRRLQGQFFTRYANRYAFTRNFLVVQRDLQKTQIVNMGLSLNFF